MPPDTLKPKRRLAGRGLVLVAILLAILAVWVLFHSRIHHELAVRFFLNAPSPTEDAFRQLATESRTPDLFLKRCWQTGKIPHRQLVAAFLKDQAASNPAWFARAEPLATAGALDADFSVRELALAALQVRNDPRLFDLARAQLKDVDPMLRELGLEYLRPSDASRGVPAVMPLLDDPDPQVVTRAESALRRWTGQDFGVRVRMAIHSADPGVSGASDIARDDARIREGVALRKQWWQAHAKDFPALPDRPVQIESFPRPPVADFALMDLAGNSKRLTDFRGQVVVLNFWATWCTACLAEIPDLIALHQQAPSVAVLGVALDGLPDEHHHEGAEAKEAEEHSLGKSLQEIRRKVLRAVKARGITYPVYLDPRGLVGGRFNGGELPTTVILDREGRIRRRFIGERNLAVFQAMVQEAGTLPN